MLLNRNLLLQGSFATFWVAKGASVMIVADSPQGGEVGELPGG